MKRTGWIFSAALMAAASLASAPLPNLTGNWTLAESQVSYTVNHFFKKATGTSAKTRGKGRCSSVECEFLLAVPVASFDSGDSNRDLHMLEVTKGAAFPMATVRTKFHPSALSQNQLKIDLEIDFAGHKSVIQAVMANITPNSQTGVKIDAYFTLKLSDFGIAKPALLGLAIDDEVPIQVSSTWRSK